LTQNFGQYRAIDVAAMRIGDKEFEVSLHQILMIATGIGSLEAKASQILDQFATLDRTEWWH
jgi:hypothetical protein